MKMILEIYDKLNRINSKKVNIGIEKFNINMDSKKAYDIWFTNHLNQGENPTHVYTNNFPREKFIVVEKDYYTGDKYGSDARHVISLNGNNIKVSGDCQGYVIKEGKATTRANLPRAPLYRDFKYMGKEKEENQRKKVIPLNNKLIEEIIYSEGMDKQELIELIYLRYENFIAGTFPYFHTFPQKVIQTIKSTNAVRTAYLDLLLEQVEHKHGGCLPKEDVRKMYTTKKTNCLIRDSIKIEKICKWSLKNGMPNVQKSGNRLAIVHRNGCTFTAFGEYQENLKKVNIL